MIFIDNKYTKWYLQLIKNAKTKKYKIFEKHHIIPQSLGGSNKSENIVNLSLREHYIAHLLLVKMLTGENKHKMLYALHRMCFSGKYGQASRLYEKWRIEFLESLKINHPSKKDINYGKKISVRVKKQWRNDDERKKHHAEQMKQKWKSGLLNTEISRKNGKHGLKGNKAHNSIALEYKGVVYYGWRELEENTKVTKHLYKKYYLNGLDPEPRIGCDGPVPNL